MLLRRSSTGKRPSPSYKTIRAQSLHFFIFFSVWGPHTPSSTQVLVLAMRPGITPGYVRETMIPGN